LFTAIATHHGAQPETGAFALSAEEVVSPDAQSFLTGLLRDHGLPASVPALRFGTSLYDCLVVSGAIEIPEDEATGAESSGIVTMFWWPGSDLGSGLDDRGKRHETGNGDA
jgi:hypothetical protein